MAESVGIGLIGAGRIGTSHARLIAERVPGAQLVAVADPRPGAAAVITDELGGAPYESPADLVADPRVDAVLIAASSTVHAELIELAAGAGKPVFCEKPMGMDLTEVDCGIAAAERAGVALQVGFNRRFAADFADMRARIGAGSIGTPQLLRSLTRDPGISVEVAARVKPWTIFNETLIHDFDTLCWLNPGARVTEVYAQADALIHPQFAEQGFLDTSVVQLRFDNGAFAVAEASFQAVYGYDVRGEVFGSGGITTAGHAPEHAAASNVELFHDAYVAQFAHFVESVQSGVEPSVTGVDARIALEVAVAARESVETRAPVALAGVPQ